MIRTVALQASTSIELLPNPIKLKNNLILSRFASFCGKPGMAMLPLAAQLHGEKREFLYCGPYLVNMAWTKCGIVPDRNAKFRNVTDPLSATKS